jgi:hypothetical protein
VTVFAFDAFSGCDLADAFEGILMGVESLLGTFFAESYGVYYVSLIVYEYYW